MNNRSRKQEKDRENDLCFLGAERKDQRRGRERDKC